MAEARPHETWESNAWERSSAAELRALRAALAIGFALELLFLVAVGWREHWLAHPQKKGLEDSQFIEAQVFEIPREAHLVDEKTPTVAPKPKAEKALSKVPKKGKEPKPGEGKLEEQNQTNAGPPPAANHGPVALFAPTPAIPDYLKDQNLHASVVIDFYVSAQGSVTPKLAGSSGNEELDAIALRTASKWEFRAAEREHKPIDSKVRLRINFEVN
jgi:TonB family protein